jgi:hypothetical protein
MSSFFRRTVSADPIYQGLRDGTGEHYETGREYLEYLWREFREYIDKDAAQKACLNFNSVFWELHLAHALRDVGKTLKTRLQVTYKNNKDQTFARRIQLFGLNA